MARKRAFKKRVDYRNGGRVRASYGAFLGDQQGGESTESDAGNRDTVTGKFDSEGPAPDPPGTVESGDFTYTSENDQRNFL